MVFPAAPNLVEDGGFADIQQLHRLKNISPVVMPRHVHMMLCHGDQWGGRQDKCTQPFLTKGCAPLRSLPWPGLWRSVLQTFVDIQRLVSAISSFFFAFPSCFAGFNLIQFHEIVSYSCQIEIPSTDVLQGHSDMSTWCWSPFVRSCPLSSSNHFLAFGFCVLQLVVPLLLSLCKTLLILGLLSNSNIRKWQRRILGGRVVSHVCKFVVLNP